MLACVLVMALYMRNTQISMYRNPHPNPNPAAAQTSDRRQRGAVVKSLWSPPDDDQARDINMYAYIHLYIYICCAAARRQIRIAWQYIGLHSQRRQTHMPPPPNARASQAIYINCKSFCLLSRLQQQSRKDGRLQIRCECVRRASQCMHESIRHR